MNSTNWLIFRILASAALVAYALSRADLPATLQSFAGIFWLPFAGLLIANFATRLIAALRWYRLASPGLPAARYADFLRITLGSSFFGQFLPGGGVEALQFAGLARSRESAEIAFASIFADRMFGFLALTLLLGAGILSNVSLLGASSTFLGLAALLIFWLFIVYFSDSKTFARIHCFLDLHAGRTRAGNSLVKVWAFLKTYFTRRSSLIEPVALAVSLQILRITVYFLAALALGTSVPIPALLLSVSAILLLMILPISVGGIGIRESALVYFFSLYGLSAELAIGVALLIYASHLLVSLPGAWFGLVNIRVQRSR